MAVGNVWNGVYKVIRKHNNEGMYVLRERECEVGSPSGQSECRRETTAGSRQQARVCELVMCSNLSSTANMFMLVKYLLTD
jgi:hypothetical protein